MPSCWTRTMCLPATGLVVTASSVSTFIARYPPRACNGRRSAALRGGTAPTGPRVRSAVRARCNLGRISKKPGQPLGELADGRLQRVHLLAREIPAGAGDAHRGDRLATEVEDRRRHAPHPDR